MEFIKSMIRFKTMCDMWNVSVYIPPSCLLRRASAWAFASRSRPTASLNAVTSSQKETTAYQHLSFLEHGADDTQQWKINPNIKYLLIINYFTRKFLVFNLAFIKVRIKPINFCSFTDDLTGVIRVPNHHRESAGSCYICSIWHSLWLSRKSNFPSYLSFSPLPHISV